MENPDPAWALNKGGRALDSDLDGQAIDIFVFSNGQQYSPPRKYHLQSDDIHLWKSTLNHLAKTQYGPLYSSVDLYTTDGIQVQDPKQLSDMGSYVAVQPPDNFIFAGYDKYLVKASRSWERRNSKRDESALELNKVNVEEMTQESIMKSRDTSVDPKKIASNMPNQDGSTIIRPQLLPTPQKPSLMPLKPQEKKVIQSRLLARKITLSSSPAPLRNSFKRKDSLKMTNNGKITRPECNRQTLKSFSGSSGANLGKSVPKYGVNQTPIKSKQPISSNAVLPKVQEVTNEMRTSSTVQLTVATEQRSSTISSELKNIIEDKSLLKSSNLYEIPRRELPSLDANQNPIQSNICPLVRQAGNISVTSKLCSTRYSENDDQYINKLNGKNKIDVSGHDILESINVNNGRVNNSAREKITAEKLLHEQYLYRELSQKPEDPVNVANGKKISLPSIVFYPNMSTTDKNKTQDSPVRKSSVMMATKLQDEFKIAELENKVTSAIVVSTSKSSETIKVYNNNSSPPRSSIMNKAIASQFITQNTMNVSASTATDKLFNNQIIATLKKGDVVNFQLNIEIENHNSGLTEQKVDLTTQSITVQTERGSQSYLDDQFITQNKSLLTLVTKKLKNHYIGDNHRIIIIQCNNCKYCDHHNSSTANKGSKKDFVILLPNEKFEEISERCHCNDTDPEILEPNTDNPAVIACSCTSLQRMSKVGSLQLPEETGTQNDCVTPNPKNNDEVLTVVRKKTVAINEESTIPNTREHSTIFQEINVKSELIAVSVESIGTGHKVAMIDKSTQTDWCDVLLEATLLSDGHYTLRLPSLEIVKRYMFT